MHERIEIEKYIHGTFAYILNSTFILVQVLYSQSTIASLLHFSLSFSSMHMPEPTCHTCNFILDTCTLCTCMNYIQKVQEPTCRTCNFILHTCTLCTCMNYIQKVQHFQFSKNKVYHHQGNCFCFIIVEYWKEKNYVVEDDCCC